MSSTERQRKRMRRAVVELDDMGKATVSMSVTMACALRAAQGKPVEFEQRKRITNAAIGGYVHSTKHIDKMNRYAAEDRERQAFESKR